MKTRVHIWVNGRVQGVYFRFATQGEALKHDVTGWVRNTPDGRVEAVFEGDEAAVHQMIAFCHKGPPYARVHRVDVIPETYQGEFKRFEVRY